MAKFIGLIVNEPSPALPVKEDNTQVNEEDIQKAEKKAESPKRKYTKRK